MILAPEFGKGLGKKMRGSFRVRGVRWGQAKFTRRNLLLFIFGPGLTSVRLFFNLLYFSSKLGTWVRSENSLWEDRYDHTGAGKDPFHTRPVTLVIALERLTSRSGFLDNFRPAAPHQRPRGR